LLRDHSLTGCFEFKRIGSSVCEKKQGQGQNSQYGTDNAGFHKI